MPVVCFLTTGIDNLVLHDTLISKNALHKIVAPLVRVYTDVATLVMAKRAGLNSVNSLSRGDLP